MERYLFAYKVKSTGRESEFSTVADSQEDAEAKIRAHIADMEFTEEDDIIVGDILKKFPVKEHYYECAGCT